MTGVEVLTPLRLETRFEPIGPPGPAGEPVGGWTLHVRVYPDDFALATDVPAPTSAELEILAEALSHLEPGPPLAGNGALPWTGELSAAEAAAFRAAAQGLGAPRAWLLWRTATTVVDQGRGPIRVVSVAAPADPEHRTVKPVGLPAALGVWFLRAGGSRELAATMHPDAAAIAADLELAALAQTPGQPVLPALWWLDVERAKAVGLACDIPLASATDLDALVVVGTGETPASTLLAAHRDAGRLAAIAQGTPTHAVAGVPAAPLGKDADSWLPLLEGSADRLPAAAAVLRAVAGIPPALLGSQLPFPGGELDHTSPGRIAVRALWPVLWGRWFRDTTGAGRDEPRLAEWAEHWLDVQGPVPAVRVDDVPYGILPTSDFAGWVADPDDDPGLASLEDHILWWALPWRAIAADAVPATPPVIGADARRMLDVLGRHAPTQHWMVRPALDLPTLQALQIARGAPVSFLTGADRSSAAALRGLPLPLSPIGAAGTRRHLPGPPDDGREDPEILRRILELDPETLYAAWEWPLGLVGHLARESMIAARAAIGQAWQALANGVDVDSGAPVPLDDSFPHNAMTGADALAEQVRASGPEGEVLARRFDAVQGGIRDIVKRYEADDHTESLLRAVKAALDTASFRVDPWLTGVAFRRLERLADAGAPFRLGAYGWVDAPRPWRPADTSLLAPGPTAAGLLHAPSFAQAQTAAVLRDAAVRNRADGPWQVNLTSTAVRAAVELGERVAFGQHPMEALGLQVEAIAGAHEAVRTLRTAYPTTADEPSRRVCDGLAVIDAVREGSLPAAVVAALPVGFAAAVAPLGEVLDTYADLLMVDGVHGLMTGRPDTVGAAMEPAAGLGRPSDLRGIRTPRESSGVAVSCWAVLPAPVAAPWAGGALDPHPASVADPAFFDMLGAGAFAGATAADAPGGVGADDVAGRAEDDPAVAGLAAVLGGGETEPPSPAGADPRQGIGAEAEAPGHPAAAARTLVAAMTADLAARRRAVLALARAAVDETTALDPAAPTTPDRLRRLDRRWRLGLPGPAEWMQSPPEPPDGPPDAAPGIHPAVSGWTVDELRDEAVRHLQARLPAAGAPEPVSPAALRADIRALVGRAGLPVLPVVARRLLPRWRRSPAGDPRRLDREWLEIVAAAHERLAPLDAHQFIADEPWPSALYVPDPAGAAGPPAAAPDPWSATGPVQVAYGPGLDDVSPTVAVALVDAWTDQVPASTHTTHAAFGFNAPKTRAPQAVLLAVPPDPARRLQGEALLDAVLGVRELARARGARPTDRAGLPAATPAPLVELDRRVNFLEGWW